MILMLMVLAQAMAPLDGWAVYREDAQSCVATRFFGTAGAPMQVRIARSNGSKYDGSISVDYPATWSAPPPTSIPLGKSGPARPVPGVDGTVEGTVVTGAAGRSWPATIQIDMDQYHGSRRVGAWVGRDAIEALGKAGSARIERPGSPPVDLAIGDVPVVALDQCRRRILQEWGVDPAKLIDAPDVAATWFRDDDYPAPARRYGAQGRVVAAVDIGPDGVIKTCRVVVSTGSKELDDATCSVVLLRGSLPPAPGVASRTALIRTYWKLGN